MYFVTNCFFFVSILLHIFGLFFFFIGFLPMSPIEKHSGDDTMQMCSKSVEKGHLYANQKGNSNGVKKKKMVLMIVDALREDFVFKGNRMPYLQKLVRENKTISFLAKGHPPTVTLPRIKAMVTGRVPGFIDVVWNFGTLSAELREDNLIQKLFQSGKKMNFFGDDTWLKLFPNCFMRIDGTTSFVVSDYKEVDDNVTRHLPDELSKHDWDVLILHFLGLDHIGHSAGPTSPLIAPKLLEMDQIIKDIMESLLARKKDSDEDALFILTSDHGMNDAGSHGGASEAEIFTPLVFITPTTILWNAGEYFSRKVVSQVDLTPSIASWFDLEIPHNSVGKVLIELLKFLPHDVKKEWLGRNICQLSKQSNLPEIDSLSGYCEGKNSPLESTTVGFLDGLLEDSSHHLQKQSSEYRIEKMNFGIVFLGFSVILALQTIRNLTYKYLDIWFCISILLHLFSVTSSSYIEEEHQFWYFIVTTSVFIMLLRESHLTVEFIDGNGERSAKQFEEHNVMRNEECNVEHNEEPSLEPKMESNVKRSEEYSTKRSMERRIERNMERNEERNVKRSTIKNCSSSYDMCLFHALPYIVILVVFRVVKVWNQTGVKWLNQTDIASVLFTREMKSYAIVVLLASLVLVFCLYFLQASIFFKICGAFALGMIFVQKLIMLDVLKTWFFSLNGVIEAKIVFVFCIVFTFKNLISSCLNMVTRRSLQTADYQHRSSDSDVSATSNQRNEAKSKDDSIESLRTDKGGYFCAFLLLYIVLLRPHNVVWLCLVAVIERTLAFLRSERLSSRDAGDLAMVILYYCLSKASFHAQGHSNSLACIDVSAAFIGMDHYSPLLSGFLTSTVTFGAHVLWFLSLKNYSSSKNRFSNESEKWTIRLVYNAILTFESLILCSICYINRYHLFIWTVFAPKFLFVVSFRIFMLIIVFVC